MCGRERSENREREPQHHLRTERRDCDLEAIIIKGETHEVNYVEREERVNQLEHPYHLSIERRDCDQRVCYIYRGRT